VSAAADSSHPGYLGGVSGVPYGDALEDFFHGVIAGITGLVGSLVRPKYQDAPPTEPQLDVDWVAFRAYVHATPWSAFREQLSDGATVVEGEEVVEVLLSFWGPNYQETERRWRDGLQVPQNRDELFAAGVALVGFADPVVVPLLVKERWVKHADVRATFRRWASRTYQVRTLASADGTIRGDGTPAGEVLGTVDTTILNPNP
jgi:hypothetical protein